MKPGGNPQNEGDWMWFVSANVGYYIPIRDHKGRIIRLRLATGKDKGPKYIWFSSEPTVYRDEMGKWCFYDPLLEKEKHQNYNQMHRGGASSGAPINVVPPPKLLSMWQPGDDISNYISMEKVVVTEGEHKSNIAAKHLNLPVIGVPGVGQWRDVVDLIKEWGTKKLQIAYDMDSIQSVSKAGEKNQAVFDHLVDFASAMLQHDIHVVLWTWNIHDGKGLDDLLLNKKAPIEIDLKTKSRRNVEVSFS